MMLRNTITVALAIAALALPSVVHAAIYSPTQAQLAGAVFADFIDNVNPDNAALTSTMNVDTDAVKYTFNTDFDTNDALWRVAVENSDFTLDLTPYDAFNITFSNPVLPDPGLNLRAQIFVRSVADTVFTGVNSVGLIAGTPVTVSIPKQRIIDLGGDPADVSSFGIEFFGGDEFLGTTFSATASTSPQPPNLEDHLLFSWETADNPATTTVNEAFEGWRTLQGNYVNGTVPHPDHTHIITTTGATQGTKALEIDRLVTGNGLPDNAATTTFRWGSVFGLDANAGAVRPQGDYSNNNRVDAADYTRWRNSLGSTTANLPNDPTPTSVTQADFDLWKTNFGQAGSPPNAAVLAQIASIVSLINDPDAYSVSFDLRMEDNNPNPNPAWTNMFLAIQATDGNPNDTNDAWWQSPQIDVDLSGLASGQVTMTLDFLLSQFDDANENGVQSLKAVGIDPATQYLGITLATNVPIDGAPVTYKFYIDNFRVRHIVPAGSGGLAGSGAPEPSTMALLVISCWGALGLVRRRS